MINEVNTTQFSGIVDFRFLDGPLLPFFAFRRIRQIFPILWPHRVWLGSELFSCQSLSGPCTSIRWFSFNTVPLVKAVYVSDNSRSPSTFQQSSLLFSSITSKDGLVALVTSMYFSGIGNDSSLGTYSLTLGSTRWRFLKFPDMDPKSFLASPASGNES